MKFLHLGDLHIGKTLGDFDLIPDQEHILKEVIRIAKENKVDALLIAGDVYDKSIPSEAAVRLLDKFLCRLAEEKIPAYLISGNHDSDERLNFGSSLFEAKNIYIAGKYEGEIFHQTLKDEFGDLHIYMLPFVKASYVRHYYPEAEINDYNDAVRVALEAAKIDPSQRNILVAHQFVAGHGGSGDPVLAGSEGLAVKNVGTLERIFTDNFDAFDYVALGHIHNGQQVGRREIRYAGSPLKYSLSEVNNKKTVPLITINEKNAVDIELVPLQPKRDMRHLKGKLDVLLNPLHVTDQDDFIYVTLTDEDVINNAMGIFQMHYPNTVKITYDNAHTHEIENWDQDIDVKDKGFGELAEDFYKWIYGCEMSDEELKVLMEVAKEAGIALSENEEVKP